MGFPELKMREFGGGQMRGGISKGGAKTGGGIKGGTPSPSFMKND